MTLGATLSWNNSVNRETEKQKRGETMNGD